MPGWLNMLKLRFTRKPVGGQVSTEQHTAPREPEHAASKPGERTGLRTREEYGKILGRKILREEYAIINRAMSFHDPILREIRLLETHAGIELMMHADPEYRTRTADVRGFLEKKRRGVISGLGGVSADSSNWKNLNKLHTLLTQWIDELSRRK
ncbi:MAG: hypothetical protein AABW99_04715 [archaeon]